MPKSRLFVGICGALIAFLGVSSVIQADDATIFGDLTLESGSPQLVFHDTDEDYFWEIFGDANFDIFDDSEGTNPFRIEAGALDFSFVIASNGNIGMGTDEPNMILAKAVGGRVLNVKSPSGAGQVAVQGAGSYLSMVNTIGAANKKTLRLRVFGNLAYFEVPKDDLSAYTVPNAIVIDMGNGNIGMGIVPETGKALKMKSGAHCTGVGVWTDASSRELKQDIAPITSDQARETVRALQPVGYRYKEEPDEKYVGFIAEDVPELVATNDRKSLAPMDVVAVLTKVVQDQDRQLERERERNDRLEATLASVTRRLAELERKSERRE